MTTVHIGYLKGNTADLLTIRAEEENGMCEFRFGDITIIYFLRHEDAKYPWVAYFDGMPLMRTGRFCNLAFFLNSVVRSKMEDVVLINCWVENHQ